MIICSDQKDNFYFSYLLHNCYKALFNATVVPDDEVTNENEPITYKIIKNETTGIKPRFYDGELLTMYLTPSQSKMNFGHLKGTNDEAINRLKTLTQSPKVRSKINYIQELNHLIDDYCTKTKPLEKAKKLFSDYVMALNPKHKKLLKTHSYDLYEDEDTKNFLVAFVMKADHEQKECYSGEMTTRKAIEFWLDPLSVQLGLGDADLGYLIRYAAINFLLLNKNQSSMERSFGLIKRGATSSRNNLNHENALAEALVREFKRNSTIFDTITSAEQPTSADEPTDKKLRKVYNVKI